MEPAKQAIRSRKRNRFIISSVLDLSRSHACPLLAISGHQSRLAECPLLGVKRTSPTSVQMSAFDPKRTFPHSDLSGAQFVCGGRHLLARRPADVAEGVLGAVRLALVFSVSSCSLQGLRRAGSSPFGNQPNLSNTWWRATAVHLLARCSETKAHARHASQIGARC